MPTTTAPRQTAKKLRRQARTMLRKAEAVDTALMQTINDMRFEAVTAEPAHRHTHKHLGRCHATQPFPEAI